VTPSRRSFLQDDKMGIFGNSLFTMLPEADMHGWLQLGGRRGDGEWIYAALPRLHDGLYVYKNDIASEPRFIVPLDNSGQLRLSIEGVSGTFVVTSSLYGNGARVLARFPVAAISACLRLLSLFSCQLPLLPCPSVSIFTFSAADTPNASPSAFDLSHPRCHARPPLFVFPLVRKQPHPRPPSFLRYPRVAHADIHWD
jgi:hypothetical protein